MAKKLNKNVVTGVILVIAAILSGAGFVAVANLPGQDPAVYFQNAKDAEAEKDYERAAQLYLRAYWKDPAQRPDYLVGAARCLLEHGNIGDAITYVEQARARDAAYKPAAQLSTEIQFEIVKLMRSTVQWKRVHTEAQRLLDLDPQSFLGNLAFGQACLNLVGEGEEYRSEGATHLRKALDLDPTSVEAVQSNIQFLLSEGARLEQLNRREEANASRRDAERLLTSAMAKCKESDDPDKLLELRRLAALIELRSGDAQRTAQGIKMMEELVATGGKATQAYVELGAHYLSSEAGSGIAERKEAFARAEACFKKAIEGAPSEGTAYLYLGRLHALNGDAKAQEEAYRRGLEAVPFGKHFKQLLSNYHRSIMLHELCMIELRRAGTATGDAKEKAIAAAETWLDALRKEVPPDSLQILTLNAYLSNARGDYVKATKEIEAADRLVPSGQAFEIKALMGELYIRQEQWGAARRALEEALVAERGMPRLYLMLAQVYLRLGQHADVIRILKPDFPGAKPLRDFLENDPGAIELRMQAYRESGQLDLATRESDKLKEVTKDDSGALVRRAGLLLMDNKFAEAETIYIDLIKKDPMPEPAVRGLVYIYEKTNRRDETIKILDRALAQDPEHRAYRSLRFSLGQDPNKPADESAMLEFLNQEKDPATRALNLHYYYSSRQDWTKALQYLDEVETIQPKDVSVLDRQFVIALKEQDWDRATKYAQKLADQNADGSGGRVAHGRLAIAKKDWNTAIQLLTLGLSQDQGLPNFSLGWAYLAEAYAGAGRMADAKQALVRSLEIDPTNGLANRAMSQLAAQEGDEAGEEKYLRAAAKVIPDDPYVKQQLAILAEKKDPTSGITKREKIRQENPKDIDNLIRLARLYKETRNYNMAAEVYKTALKAADNDLQVARELAGFYALKEVNRPQEGETLLQELLRAQEQLSKKAIAAMYLAYFYESQRQITKADTIFKTAIKFDPNPEILSRAAEFFIRTTNMQAAIDCYREILKADADDSIRRTSQSRLIAILLAVRDLDASRKEIDDFIRRYPDDGQGRVFLGTFHMQGGDINKAEEAFTLELEQHPSNATALWQRGQLYCLKGEWGAAVDDLVKAKRQQPDGFNYHHRIVLADALIEMGKGDEAIVELRSILDARGDEPNVAAALADAYMRVRPARINEAEELATQFMRKYPRQESWPLLLGRLGEEARDYNKAIAAYEKAAEISQYSPPVIERLFTAYRRANRPGDIIRYAEEKLSLQRLAESPLALASVGWAQAEKGRQDDAFLTYDLALTAAQVDYNIYNIVMGDFVSRFGQEKVLDWTRRQLEKSPDQVRQRKNLLHLLFINEKDDEALEAADWLVKNAVADLDTVFAYMGRAAVLERQRRFPDARESYEKVLKVAADNISALNNLAYMLVDKMNLPEEALVYSERAAKLAPKSAEVLDTHGWVLFKLKRYGEATTYLLRAIEQDRHHPVLSYHLGCVYLKRKDKTQAIRRLNDARTFLQEKPGYPILPMIEEALREAEALP